MEGQHEHAEVAGVLGLEGCFGRDEAEQVLATRPGDDLTHPGGRRLVGRIDLRVAFVYVVVAGQREVAWAL